jgi:gluconokinase
VARVLAIDVGSSSARAQLFDERAEPVGQLAQAKYEGERDALRLVELARGVIGEAGSADDVGISCFGHSLVGLGSDSRPVTPILDWRDVRSAAAAEGLLERLDGGAVHARTGCHIHPSYWPAKLAWLAQEEPAVFATAERFVGVQELLPEREPTISLSQASATGLLDLREARWDEELLETLGLDEARLPRIGDEPVDGWYPALLDGVCSNLGSGCTGRHRAALMIGTSGAYRTLYETAELRPRPGLFLYRADERRVLEGGALSDGGNLRQWLEETLRSEESDVAERPPDGHGLTFLALLGGERSPGWSTHARGAIHGLTLASSPLDIRQAAYEGVAYRFAEVAGLMPEVQEIVATGGGVADDDWVQILADVLERPLTRSGVPEASLRGAAVAVLERLGEAPASAPLGDVVEPRPERFEAYRAARERQRRIYDAAT